MNNFTTQDIEIIEYARQEADSLLQEFMSTFEDEPDVQCMYGDFLDSLIQTCENEIESLDTEDYF